MASHLNLKGFVEYVDKLKQNNYDVISVGKITDIFNGCGITESIKTKDNFDGILKILNVKENEILTDIPTYTVDGFEFTGWSLDRKTKYDLNKGITSDLKLHPLLEEVKIAKKRGCTKCATVASLIYISAITSFALMILKKRK